MNQRWSKPAYQQILHEATLKPRDDDKMLELCLSCYHGYFKLIGSWSKQCAYALKLISAPNANDISCQSRELCKEYIYQKLRRNGSLSLKLEVIAAQFRNRPTDVSQEIQRVGYQLENLYPQLYKNISKQLNITMTSDNVVRNTFKTIAERILNDGDINWGQVIALFCVAGGIATDCVQQGHPEFVKVVINTFVEVTNLLLVPWLVKQGGWVSVLHAFRTSQQTQAVWLVTGFVFVLTLLIFITWCL